MATLAAKWIEKGEKKALLKSIETGLECKFGKDALKLLSEVKKINDPEVLLAICRKLWETDNPDELQKALNENIQGNCIKKIKKSKFLRDNRYPILLSDVWLLYQH